MMRKLLLFCCLLFGAVSVSLAQQGFKVSVLNDAEEPLSYAYIYVNDKAVAMTDTLGLAVIPRGKLKIGDSISVSYVATKGQSVVVDHTMLVKGEYEFLLDETHGTLLADAVVVKAKIKRLYRRSLPIKRLPPYPYYGVYSTHFTMNRTSPGDSVPSHWVAGRLEGVYTSLYILEMMFKAQYHRVVGSHFTPNPIVFDSLLRDPLFRVGFVNDLPLKITTNDDTTGLEKTLKYFLPRALRTANLVLSRVHKPEPNYKELEVFPEAKVNYGYLGKDQDTSKFRLTYSGHGVGTTSELLIMSDVADRINREIVEATLSFKDTINGNSYYVKAKTRDATIWEYIGGKWNREMTIYYDHTFWIICQVPFEVEYRVVESDGTVVNVTMSNINIRSLFKEMNSDLEAIHSVYRPEEQYDWLCMYYREIVGYLERMALDKQRIEAKQQKKGRKSEGNVALPKP